MDLQIYLGYVKGRTVIYFQLYEFISDINNTYTDGRILRRLGSVQCICGSVLEMPKHETNCDVTTRESCISVSNYIVLGSPNSCCWIMNKNIKIFNNDGIIACQLLRRHFWAGNFEFGLSANQSSRFISRDSSQLTTDKSHHFLVNTAPYLAGNFDFLVRPANHRQGWGLSVTGLAPSRDLN